MESIMQNDKVCFLCGRNGATDPLESHHVLGASNRKKSEQYGLKVWLCGDRCHRNGPGSVHRNRMVADNLKAAAQKTWEETYGTTNDFIRIFGRNYR